MALYAIMKYLIEAHSLLHMNETHISGAEISLTHF